MSQPEFSFYSMPDATPWKLSYVLLVIGCVLSIAPIIYFCWVAKYDHSIFGCIKLNRSNSQLEYKIFDKYEQKEKAIVDAMWAESAANYETDLQQMRRQVRVGTVTTVATGMGVGFPMGADDAIDDNYLMNLPPGSNKQDIRPRRDRDPLRSNMHGTEKTSVRVEKTTDVGPVQIASPLPNVPGALGQQSMYAVNVGEHLKFNVSPPENVGPLPSAQRETPRPLVEELNPCEIGPAVTVISLNNAALNGHGMSLRIGDDRPIHEPEPPSTMSNQSTLYVRKITHWQTKTLNIGHEDDDDDAEDIMPDPRVVPHDQIRSMPNPRVVSHDQTTEDKFLSKYVHQSAVAQEPTRSSYSFGEQVMHLDNTCDSYAGSAFHRSQTPRPIAGMQVAPINHVTQIHFDGHTGHNLNQPATPMPTPQPAGHQEVDGKPTRFNMKIDIGKETDPIPGQNVLVYNPASFVPNKGTLQDYEIPATVTRNPTGREPNPGQPLPPPILKYQGPYGSTRLYPELFDSMGRPMSDQATQPSYDMNRSMLYDRSKERQQHAGKLYPSLWKTVNDIETPYMEVSRRQENLRQFSTQGQDAVDAISMNSIINPLFDPLYGESSRLGPGISVGTRMSTSEPKRMGPGDGNTISTRDQGDYGTYYKVGGTRPSLTGEQRIYGNQETQRPLPKSVTGMAIQQNLPSGPPPPPPPPIFQGNDYNRGPASPEQVFMRQQSAKGDMHKELLERTPPAAEGEANVTVIGNINV